MQKPRLQRYATIAATFAVALGIGFVMQNGDALASRLGVNDTQPDLADALAETYRPVTASGMAGPGRPDTGDSTLIPNMNIPADDQGVAAGCEIRFEAVPGAAAMVGLTLTAPCHPESLVTVQHQGMKFNEMTDADGLLALQVPALSKEAYFVATVENTAGVVAITGVQDLALYDRAVLQWRGDLPLELHALELGASEGDRGFLTRLGTTESTAPMIAEVYTYPSGISPADGHVALNVRAKIITTNCGRRVAAQSIKVRPGQPPAARNIVLDLPACEKVGEYLVLKNVFEDLTLASR